MCISLVGCGKEDVSTRKYSDPSDVSLPGNLILACVSPSHCEDGLTSPLFLREARFAGSGGELEGGGDRQLLPCLSTEKKRAQENCSRSGLPAHPQRGFVKVRLQW